MATDWTKPSLATWVEVYNKINSLCHRENPTLRKGRKMKQSQANI